MTKRLALTPAVGLFAGLSVVSYGAVSMMLTGVHGTRTASTASCTTSSTASATASTKALTRPAGRVRARAQHPAAMPVLLAYAVKQSKHDGTQAPAGSVAAQANQAAGSASASQTQSASQSSPPLPGTQPNPTANPPLPQPVPGASVGPGPGGLPQPVPASTTKSHNPLTPGGTLKSPAATATATPTSTPSKTPTPTTSPSTTPPSDTLCMTIRTLDNRSAVDPHTKIGYAIFVWLAGSADGSAKVTLSARPSSVSPTFSVCAATGKAKCTLSLTAGKKSELQAELAAPDRPARRVVLTATATSSQALNSATASATVDIKPKNTSPGASPTPTPNAGDGGTLPPAAGLPSGTTIPGVGVGAGVQPSGDLGSAFPQVSPSPAASTPGTATAQKGHETKMVDLSAGLPLDVRLIGGQVLGLAVLAAAVTIAVARLSLRRQPAKHGGEDSTDS